MQLRNTAVALSDEIRRAEFCAARVPTRMMRGLYMSLRLVTFSSLLPARSILR